VKATGAPGPVGESAHPQFKLVTFGPVWRARELARLVTKKRQLSPSTTPSSRLTVNAAVRAILENLRPINDTRTDE